MAHVRKDSSKPTTTISMTTATLTKVDDYKFSKRKDNRSQVIEELILYGLKYKELLERKHERMMV